MNLERLITALAPTDVVHCASVEVRDLAYDARAVRPGALFCCVPGLRHDGHEFAAAAVAAGAVALVCERPLALGVPQLVVPAARAAMAVAADAFFGEPTRELRVAGSTGTNGKTTSAYLLAAILDAAGLQAGLLGTVESRVGGVVRPVVRTTPEAPQASTVRRIAPTFCGSSTSSSTTISGGPSLPDARSSSVASVRRSTSATTPWCAPRFAA